MNTELISIIVPVYNVERYLEQCVDSLIHQTYQNIEILLIDDGSTDASGVICDRYAKQDSRIRVVHQENQGAAVARNKGIELAEGNYLAFVDSDDFVHCQFLEVLYEMLQKENGKISMCSYRRVHDDDVIDNSPVSCEASQVMDIFCALSLLNEWCSKEAIAMLIICNKLYRRDVFDGVMYPLKRRREDEFVIHRVLAKADELPITESELYFYRKRAGSVMESNDIVENFQHLALHEALIDRIDFFAQKDVRLVSGAVHHLLRESNAFYDQYLTRKDRIHNIKRKQLVLQYRQVYWKYFKNLDLHEKIVGILFAFLPSMYNRLAKMKGHRNGSID